MSTLDDERFGVDLDLTGDPDANIRVTPSGDIPLIRGRSNLRAALVRMCTVEPGDLVHRPAFGGGLPGFVETLDSPRRRATLANQLRRSLLADARVREASVAVSLDGEDIVVEVSIKVAGDQAAETFTFAYSA